VKKVARHKPVGVEGILAAGQRSAKAADTTNLLRSLTRKAASPIPIITAVMPRP